MPWTKLRYFRSEGAVSHIVLYTTYQQLSIDGYQASFDANNYK